MSELCLTTAEVKAVLKSLDINEAMGPDGISARLLRATAAEIAPSLRTGAKPQEWKEANLVSVYKKGEAECAEDYRPISRLSLVSRVLERCVLISFQDLLCEVVRACQHGFRHGKSCTSNLLEMLDHIGSMLDNGACIWTCPKRSIKATIAA